LNVCIIGNGVTGFTAAIRLRERRPDWKITMISGESTHPYSRPALMYIFMGHMRYGDTKPFADSFWTERRIDLVRAWVTRIDTANRRLELHRGEPIAYDKLLLATGSKSNRFGWPGQDLEGVQGLYDLMDLRRLYENVKTTRAAVIVGGGLIGIELAEMLHTRHIPVTFIVREESFWDNVLPREESGMINRVIRKAGIGLLLERNLKSIEGDAKGRVRAAITDRGETLDCQIVGLTAGVSPNLDLVKETSIDTGRGILVDPSLRTSVDAVYAAGDCAEIVKGNGDRNLLQQVWYTGKMQGRVVADVMAGDEAIYDPGIWYNSAKFLDLEYQTYGRVGFKVEGEKSLFWEHESGLHAVRIVHTDGEGVIGFNLMGVRYRHEVCERWIREQRSPGWVLDHLAEANFDGEFFRRHENEIVGVMKEQIQ
jgi:NADPH-dependent 2,4-dienoyl-CoA reductase/sulfur reductase-like enzyme